MEKTLIVPSGKVEIPTSAGRISLRRSLHYTFYERRGVIKNSLCGSRRETISVLGSWANGGPRLRLVPHMSPTTEIAHFPPLPHNILFKNKCF